MGGRHQIYTPIGLPTDNPDTPQHYILDCLAKDKVQNTVAVVGEPERRWRAVAINIRADRLTAVSTLFVSRAFIEGFNAFDVSPVERGVLAATDLERDDLAMAALRTADTLIVDTPWGAPEHLIRPIVEFLMANRKPGACIVIGDNRPAAAAAMEKPDLRLVTANRIPEPAAPPAPS